MKIVKIDTENNINNIDINYDTDIKISLKSIDNNILELLYEWNFESNIIECYGCIDNYCNIINKHKLPPYGIHLSNIICEKSEECNIFGNIYIVCKKNGKYYDYYDYDYGMLYFNINNYNDVVNDNNENDNNENDNDENDNDENDNDVDDNDDNDNIIDNIIDKNNYKNKLYNSKYLINKNIQNDLEYDNNIY
jgi:hypothetical protein